ncbi:MAG: flagellar hook-basal body complex protein FliE [Syntrophobacterales bacterium]|jgi:flagellar hook-basal body complex protein FliE|nr:flagellar hook-basal body complex protein FliE [Syntrophobacterales bacterium]
MNDIIIGGKGALTPVEPGKAAKEESGAQTPFGTVLKQTIRDINNLQLKADQAIAKVEVDNSASIHEAMVALEKADISFKAMMQVRNKIIEAYQEIMRMQV